MKGEWKIGDLKKSAVGMSKFWKPEQRNNAAAVSGNQSRSLAERRMGILRRQT